LFKKYPRKSEREGERERVEKGRRDGDRGGMMKQTEVRKK